jgi:hypothetical protein
MHNGYGLVRLLPTQVKNSWTAAAPSLQPKAAGKKAILGRGKIAFLPKERTKIENA